MKININGKKLEAKKGESILQCAQRHRIHIPNLCAYSGLEPFGACRLCVVKVEGIAGLPTACTTLVEEDMVVKTDTEEVKKLRCNIFQLLLSEHPSACLVCNQRAQCLAHFPQGRKSGRATGCMFCDKREVCPIIGLVDEFGITNLDLPSNYKWIPLERDDPFFERDYNLCILCGLCVRICKKLHKKTAIDFVNRGDKTRIGTAFNRLHLDSGCVFCGACIDVCPTGALAERFAKWRGKPDKIISSACILCPQGCEVKFKVKENVVVSMGPKGEVSEGALCVAGRFVLPRFSEITDRIKHCLIKTEIGQHRASQKEAVKLAAEKLKIYQDGRFALLAHSSSPDEDKRAFHEFTKGVMKSNYFAIVPVDGLEASRKATSILKAIKQGKIKALLASGNFIDPKLISKLEVLIILDCFPSKLSEAADIVFPSATPIELEGTFTRLDGTKVHLLAGNKLLEEASLERQIISEIAKEMGVTSFEKKAAKNEISLKPKPRPSPLEDMNNVPQYYRGHLLGDYISGLEPIFKKTLPEIKPVLEIKEGFEIVEKFEPVPNIHLVTVKAKAIADKCQPGQFVVVMVNEKSERVPYSLADWDREKGTVTIPVMEAGRSSEELIRLDKGDKILHFVGPLGNPLKIDKFGTVVCAGGCYGIGAIYPIARAFKQAGNKVMGILEEKSQYMFFYFDDKVREVCDELIYVTQDGTKGIKGLVPEALKVLFDRNEHIDKVILIGCTFMMMLGAQATAPYHIETIAALNPIMLDATGMCGACRVTVGGETKFACVDGPFFDAHKVDWAELINRRRAYLSKETSSLAQMEYITVNPTLTCGE